MHEMQCCGFRFQAVHKMQYCGSGFGQCTKCSVVVQVLGMHEMQCCGSGFGQCTKCSVVVSGFRQCTKCSIVVQVLGSARNTVLWFRFWAVHEMQCCGSGFGQVDTYTRVNQLQKHEVVFVHALL